MQQMKEKRLVMFFYLLLNLEYKKERYANRREGDNRSYSFIPFVLSGPSGFNEKRPCTFQSHFRAYKVNIHCKLCIFANKGDFFFLPKGHLYPWYSENNWPVTKWGHYCHGFIKRQILLLLHEISNIKQCFIS